MKNLLNSYKHFHELQDLITLKIPQKIIDKKSFNISTKLVRFYDCKIN